MYDELLEKIKNKNLLKADNTLNTGKLQWLNKKKNDDIVKEIEECTSFLNVHSNISLGYRILAIVLNITQVKYCDCGKLCKLTVKGHLFYYNSCGDKACKNREKSKGWKNRSIETAEYFKNEHRTKRNIMLDEFKNKYVTNSFIEIDIAELKSFISNKVSHDYNKLIFESDINNNYNELLSIIKYTSYIIPDFSTIHSMNFAQRFYHIMNNITSPVICNICKTHEIRFSNYIQGYVNDVCKICQPQNSSIHRCENRLNKLQSLFKANNCEILIDDNEHFTTYNKQVLIKDNRCGHVFKKWMSNGRMNNIDFNTICNICHPVHIDESIEELEIFNYIKSLNFNTIEKGNRNIIYPLELDVVIPSKKIAIEYNGNYWHSEEAGKNSTYHINKTNRCLEKGYRLIHIFEDEWINKRKIVKSRIKNILGLAKYRIYARKCKVEEISGHTKDEFLEKYHIQGGDKSSVKLGLFYKNRLVAVMTFGKRRYDDKEGVELIRYATISNFNIIGGAGKLLSHYRKQHIGETIISYADKRWSLGNLYKQLGFTLIRESQPNYWYMNNENKLNRLSRQQYMKHMLKDKLEKFDESLTEVENMKNNGYKRIWDCGNYVFELK